MKRIILGIIVFLSLGGAAVALQSPNVQLQGPNSTKSTTISQCSSDLNGDGKVDVKDLSILLSHFNKD